MMYVIRGRISLISASTRSRWRVGSDAAMNERVMSRQDVSHPQETEGGESFNI